MIEIDLAWFRSPAALLLLVFVVAAIAGAGLLPVYAQTTTETVPAQSAHSPNKINEKLMTNRTPDSPSQHPAAVATTDPTPAPLVILPPPVAFDDLCKNAPYPNWQADFDTLNLTPDHKGAIYRPSCNFEGEITPDSIVLHFTGPGTLEGAIAALREPGKSSAHYVIDRDGTIYQLVPENRLARHVVGVMVTRSIGIELVNQGKVNPDAAFDGLLYQDPLRSFGWHLWEDYPPEQLIALKRLLFGISARWQIPLDRAHVFGHNQINAKNDPGPALNLFWSRPGDGKQAVLP